MEHGKKQQVSLAALFCGVMVVVGAFLRWSSFTEGSGGASWSSVEFLGLRLYANDKLLGVRHTTVLGGSLLVLLAALAHKHTTARALAKATAVLLVVVASFNLLHRLYEPLPTGAHNNIHSGLWLTLVASLTACWLLFRGGVPASAQ